MPRALTQRFKDKRFLVTGGAGFIGSHIVRALLDLQSSVVVLDDFSKETNTGTLDDLTGDLQVKQGDIRIVELSSMGPFDGIFHEAARALLPSFRDPVTDLQVNVAGTIKILEFAKTNKIKVVHASSGSVYGNPDTMPISEDQRLSPISPYAVSKVAAEYYCRLYHGLFGVDVCMLRYFNVYGPGQSVSEEMGVIPIFVERALNGEPMKIFGDGLQTRDFLHVVDVVRANLLAYSTAGIGGEVMNVGGKGEEISILSLAKEVLEICKSESQLKFETEKPGDIRRLVADSSRAWNLIGYQASVSLKQGLNDYVKYARSSRPG